MIIFVQVIIIYTSFYGPDHDLGILYLKMTLNENDIKRQ